MLPLSAPSRCPAIPRKARSSLWICSIFAAKDALDLDFRVLKWIQAT